jgi:hypothetical protein
LPSFFSPKRVAHVIDSYNVGLSIVGTGYQVPLPDKYSELFPEKVLNFLMLPCGSIIAKHSFYCNTSIIV